MRAYIYVQGLTIVAVAKENRLIQQPINCEVHTIDRYEEGMDLTFESGIIVERHKSEIHKKQIMILEMEIDRKNKEIASLQKEIKILRKKADTISEHTYLVRQKALSIMKQEG